MAIVRKKGSDRGFESVAISSITVAVGDVLAKSRSAYVATLATASTSFEDVLGVAVEAKTTADTSVLYQKLIEEDVYLADTTNNSNATHNLQRMVLTDQATVNNTGTDSTSDAAIIEQIAPVGATTDKKILCRFVSKQDRS